MILNKECACGQKVEFEAEDLPQLNCPQCGRSLHEQFAPAPRAKLPHAPPLRLPHPPRPQAPPAHPRQVSLDEVRRHSCYKTLRGLIDVVFGIGYAICGLIPFSAVIVPIITSFARISDEIGGAIVLAFVVAAILAILLTALKQSMLLAIDAVDIFIADRADRHAEARARREHAAREFEERVNAPVIDK